MKVVDIYQCCDLCFKGMRPEDYRPQGVMRPVVGSDDMTEVVLCAKCNESLAKKRYVAGVCETWADGSNS